MHIVRNSTMGQIIASAKDAGYVSGAEWSKVAWKMKFNAEQAEIAALRVERDNALERERALEQRVKRLSNDAQHLRLRLNTVYGNISNGVYTTPASAYCVLVACGDRTKYVLTSDETLATCSEFLVNYVRGQDCPNCKFTIEPF